MSNFRPVDRQTQFQLPPSVDEWLPERHLARHVEEVVAQLDLSAMVRFYRGTGSAGYHPAMLLGLLVYGYATSAFSSRKIERATFVSVAFRYIAANDHPDHDTIATFRRRFIGQFEKHFVDVIVLTREMGMLQIGTVAPEGTKIQANWSRHSALLHEHAGKIEVQFKAEVVERVALTEAADQADVTHGMSILDELARREERLQDIAEAKAKIEWRAKERFLREQAEFEAEKALHDEKQRAGKSRGTPPTLPSAGPKPTNQVNRTNEASRVMPESAGGFEQADNAQAAVAVGSLLVVGGDATQANTDKQQVRQMLGKLNACADQCKAGTLMADPGYASEANVSACEQVGIAPLISMGRESHHPHWRERFAAALLPPDDPNPLEAMAHRLAMSEGKKGYALCKYTPEPVFGIIKSVMGVRQFSLRRLGKVKGVWSLVKMAWIMKRMFALSLA